MDDLIGSDDFAVELFNKESKNLLSSATWEHDQLAEVKVRVLRGHKDSVKSCQFCGKNATKILTSSDDKSVLLWDAGTSVALKRYEGHSAFVSQAKANADATRFLSTGWDKQGLMWDTETGQVLWSGDHGGIVTCGAWSWNEKLVATGSDLDMSIRIWDSASGCLVETIRDLHKSTVTSISFSNNDDRIFTSSMDYTAKAWDLRSNLNTITLEGHTNIVSDCCCSSNGRRLATVSWDKSIRLWDISTGEYRSKGSAAIMKAHEGSISACDFSQDGSLLVTGGYDQQIIVWDVDGMVRKLRLQGHLGWVEDVCFSPDQKWILSCGKDATVRLWNIENAENITMVKESNKTVGRKLQNCVQCEKPFSSAKTETQDENGLCVFCRLQTANKTLNEYIDRSVSETTVDDL